MDAYAERFWAHMFEKKMDLKDAGIMGGWDHSPAW